MGFRNMQEKLENCFWSRQNVLSFPKWNGLGVQKFRSSAYVIIHSSQMCLRCGHKNEDVSMSFMNGSFVENLTSFRRVVLPKKKKSVVLHCDGGHFYEFLELLTVWLRHLLSEVKLVRLKSYKPNSTNILSKGQEISEWKYEVVALPKLWTKKLEKFCPEV